MRLGVVARCDDTGLGNQTREVVRHLSPQKLLVVDISSLNGNRQHYDWYENYNAIYTKGFPNRGAILDFLQDLDVVYVAESPYNYELYSLARQQGVKVAVQYNYEFFDWFVYGHYPLPDMFIAPTKWHFDVIDAFAESVNIPHIYLHFPVDRKAIPCRQPITTSRAKHFLHIAGKPAVHDRNGTESYLEMAKELHRRGTPAHFAISTQDQELQNRIMAEYGFIEIRLPVENYEDNYLTDDVLVMPRRYGGNCMPVNEALSAGMPVIMTDISPNRDWLPKSWLVKTCHMGEFRPRQLVQIYNADFQSLVDKVDWFTYRADYQEESDIADKLAQSISWEVMKPMYLSALESLCKR